MGAAIGVAMLAAPEVWVTQSNPFIPPPNQKKKKGSGRESDRFHFLELVEILWENIRVCDFVSPEWFYMQLDSFVNFCTKFFSLLSAH